ncbi:MAG: radical SAM protein [Ignavibacteria bacterium]|nr:radical SAM protein [Ignavibacteria bacterium]
MKIQSLSIVVPTNKCVNNCPYCVSKTHDNDYKDEFQCGKNPRFERDYIERLSFAKDNGVNIIILTGTGEALQNKKFLNKFATWNTSLKSPFYIIELQTTGVMLDDETLEFLRDQVRVKTISLSVSDLFDNENNLNIIGVTEKLRFNLDELCKKIKEYDFNLRISLNVLNNIEKLLFIDNDTDFKYDFNKLFLRLKELGVDQVTFRKLWKSNNNNNIDKWIEENSSDTNSFFTFLKAYIREKGKLLGRLTFGALQYEMCGENGISTVIDEDCMADEVKDTFKYLILRENGKLYTKWDSKASLIF